MIWFLQAGNEPHRQQTVSSTPIRFPVGTCLDVEFLGFDEDSYAYLSLIINENIENTYQEMYQLMEHSIIGERCVPHHMLSQGLLCIINLDTPLERRGGIYARARILEVDVTREHAKCVLVDDFSVLEIPRTQIFHTNIDVLKYNEFSIKCQVEDLICFLGFPLLKSCYEEHLKKTGSSNLGICKATIVDQPGAVPTVRITSPGSDQPFTSTLQEYMPTVGKMKYPSPAVGIKAKLTHADEKGMIWFQNWEAKQLIRVVDDLLTKIFTGTLRLKLIPLADTNSWKYEYLFGSKTISIFRLESGKSYRVKVNCWREDGSVLVSFIDYGYDGIVSGWHLYSAAHYEQNLCFIPPQCLPFKFAGAGEEENNFDKELFWDYILGDHRQVSIILKDYGVDVNTAFRGKIMPEADVSVRTTDTPADHPGQLLSVLYQRQRRVMESLRSPSPLTVRNRERPVAVVSPMPNVPIAPPSRTEAQDIDERPASMEWIVDRLRNQLSNHGSSSSSSSASNN